VAELRLVDMAVDLSMGKGCPCSEGFDRFS
jgi:hypothetical protein